MVFCDSGKWSQPERYCDIWGYANRERPREREEEVGREQGLDENHRGHLLRQGRRIHLLHKKLCRPDRRGESVVRRSQQDDGIVCLEWASVP